MDNICILGSGMAGAGAAQKFFEAGKKTKTFDKNSHSGGHTASWTFDTGFVFDEGPHISFTKNERVQRILAENVEGKFETFQAKVNNYYQGHWIKHPAQCNLHGLPTDLVENCLLDFIDAQGKETNEINNYRDWLVAKFGTTFAETFPCQYGKKYHTTVAENMSTVWLGPRLYQPSLKEVIGGALNETSPDVHYITDFRYPSHGGFNAYLTPFATRTELHLEHKLIGLDPVKKILTFSNGTHQSYDTVISSIPLTEIIPMIVGVPKEIIEAAQQLACTSCVTVNIGLDRRDILDAHWSYFYDDDYFFTRVSFPHMFSPHVVPDGCGSIQAEVYYSDKYRPLDRSAEACIEPVIKDLRRCGLIRDSDKILHQNAHLIKYANIIFDLDREVVLQKILNYLKEIGVVTVGRYGEWGYHWTDDSFLSGEAAAEKLLGA